MRASRESALRGGLETSIRADYLLVRSKSRAPVPLGFTSALRVEFLLYFAGMGSLGAFFGGAPGASDAAGAAAAPDETIDTR